MKRGVRIPGSGRMLVVSWLLVVAGGSLHVWAQCGSVSNFQSTCTQGNSPRQFQCTLQVAAQAPGAAAVMLQAQSGVFNGQPQVQAPVQNGVASFQINYQESQYNPNVNMMVHVLNAQNQSVCRFPYNGPLTACAQGAACAASTAQLWMMGGGLMYYARTSLANYSGPSIGVPIGMQGGPNSPDVARVVLEVLKAERRTMCASGPGPWQPVMLMPATPQMGGWNPATYSVPNFTTAVSTINRSIRTGYEHGFHLVVPDQKINNACGEQYRVDLRVRIVFANGCEVTQDFTNLTANRP